jgi:hypothetical protein
LPWQGCPEAILPNSNKPSAGAPLNCTSFVGSPSAKISKIGVRAEAEILRETATHPVRRAVVVNFDGVVYRGEYESTSADGYTPGEWKSGDPVPVRLAGDKLYLRRHNGRELQTTIVKRIG